MKNYINYEQKKLLIESFIYANFSYCPLVWHFCTYKSINKIESIHKRNSQLLFSKVRNNYSQLLDKAKKSTMAIIRLRCLCLEIYKAINCLNSAFMTDVFKLSDSKKPARKQNFLNINVIRPNQVKYGERSSRVLGPNIWNNVIKDKNKIYFIEKGAPSLFICYTEAIQKTSCTQRFSNYLLIITF